MLSYIIKVAVTVLIENIPTFVKMFEAWQAKRERIKAAQKQSDDDKALIDKAIEEANK